MFHLNSHQCFISMIYTPRVAEQAVCRKEGGLSFITPPSFCRVQFNFLLPDVLPDLHANRKLPLTHTPVCLVYHVQAFHLSLRLYIRSAVAAEQRSRKRVDGVGKCPVVLLLGQGKGEIWMATPPVIDIHA